MIRRSAVIDRCTRHVDKTVSDHVAEHDSFRSVVHFLLNVGRNAIDVAVDLKKRYASIVDNRESYSNLIKNRDDVSVVLSATDLRGADEVILLSEAGWRQSEGRA